MEDIVLIGFGGHAKSVADSIERQGEYRIVGYTDIENKDAEYKYLGTDSVLESLYEQGIKNACITIGFMGGVDHRISIYDNLKNIGYNLPIIIDPSAIVSDKAKLEEGCFVGKGAVVNTESKIGKIVTINSMALIEHECKVGDFSHVAVRATLCGGAAVGMSTFVGANSTVIQERNIGNNVIVGAGSTILNDIDSESKVYGVVK